MNPEQYRIAITRLMDRDCPDVHMEVLLCFGPPDAIDVLLPRETGEWVEWRASVRKQMSERHGFKRTRCLQTDTVLDIIERRIGDELARSNVRQDE